MALVVKTHNKLTENVQGVGLLRLADGVADLALDNLPVPGPVEAGQHQHGPVLAPEHLLGPEEPLVGHELRVGLGPAPESVCHKLLRNYTTIRIVGTK